MSEMFSFKRQGTFGDRDQSILHRTFHDKYVVHYDFSDVGAYTSHICPLREPPCSYHVEY